MVYFLRNLQTSLANNSRILRIKNVKFSGYCYDTNIYIQGDFQICISALIKEEKCKHQCSHISQTFRSSCPEEFCWITILKKFVKFTRKLWLWRPSLVLCSYYRLKSLQLYKGLHYDWFHDETSNFRKSENSFFTKTTLDGCFYSLNLTIQNY